MVELEQLSFFDTIGESPVEAQQSEEQAQRQERVILELYDAGVALSPWDVLDRLEDRGYDWPITSVRRAITVLTTKGKLTKTSRRRLGRLGKPNYVWEKRWQ